MDCPIAADAPVGMPTCHHGAFRLILRRTAAIRDVCLLNAVYNAVFSGAQMTLLPLLLVGDGAPHRATAPRPAGCAQSSSQYEPRVLSGKDPGASGLTVRGRSLRRRKWA